MCLHEAKKWENNGTEEISLDIVEMNIQYVACLLKSSIVSGTTFSKFKTQNANYARTTAPIFDRKTVVETMIVWGRKVGNELFVEYL